MLKPVLSLLVLLASATAVGAEQWVEGKHYFVIQPAAPYAPQEGKVEVTEVFSYGCPACFRVHPFILQLAAKLPPSATLDFLPASFRPDEAWPMFQRAYYAAQSLGIADETHDAAFDAVWKTGELATMDPATRRARIRCPRSRTPRRSMHARRGSRRRTSSRPRAPSASTRRCGARISSCGRGRSTARRVS